MYRAIRVENGGQSIPLAARADLEDDAVEHAPQVPAGATGVREQLRLVEQGLDYFVPQGIRYLPDRINGISCSSFPSHDCACMRKGATVVPSRHHSEKNAFGIVSK